MLAWFAKLQAGLFLCAALVAVAPAAEPKRLLLVGQGPDGHPAATHEFMTGLSILERCLQPVEGLKVTTVKADEPWIEGPKLLSEADGVVLFLSQGARWMQTDPGRYQALAKLASRGGGISALHWAVGAQDGKYVAGQQKLLGASRGGPQRKYTVADFDVELASPDHPILRGVKPLTVHDEFYYRLEFLPELSGKDAAARSALHPLLTAKIDGRAETVAWAWERPGGGRSFGFVGLHFHRNWKLVEYRRLAAQGALWTIGMDVPKEGLAVEIAPADLELPTPAKK